MRNKLSWVIGLVQGILLLLASLIIPLCKTVNSDIVGGAGWPVFRFYFEQTQWLFTAGSVITLVSVAALYLRSHLK